MAMGPEVDLHTPHWHTEAPAAPAAGRVGLLLADHGEPLVYDENTYWSFRGFVDGLMDAGVIPPYLRNVDTGTIAHQHHGTLLDAWLRPHDPAVAVALPDVVTIRRGGTVRWRWTGHHPHDVKFRPSRTLPRVRAGAARLEGTMTRRFRRSGS
jgi:hypothetical protein